MYNTMTTTEALTMGFAADGLIMQRGDGEILLCPRTIGHWFYFDPHAFPVTQFARRLAQLERVLLLFSTPDEPVFAGLPRGFSPKPHPQVAPSDGMLAATWTSTASGMAFTLLGVILPDLEAFFGISSAMLAAAEAALPPYTPASFTFRIENQEVE